DGRGGRYDARGYSACTRISLAVTRVSPDGYGACQPRRLKTHEEDTLLLTARPGYGAFRSGHGDCAWPLELQSPLPERRAEGGGVSLSTLGRAGESAPRQAGRRLEVHRVHRPVAESRRAQV